MTFSAVFDTSLHADCVRFVPTERERQIAVFSCYELEERTGKRLGKLILAEKTGATGVQVLQSVLDLPGVFEFTWFPDDSNVLVAALAEGPPKLFKYESGAETRLVALESGSSAAHSDAEMTLAVAGGPDSLVTCDNKGSLRQWAVGRGATLEVNQEWTGHDAEVWHVSQDPHSRSLFYSGSDDFSMKCWDIRCDTHAAVAANKSAHEAGVCCVVSSPWDEFTVASGSYDGKVRLWDRRRAFRGDPVASVDCGSGAWRVVWNPQKSTEIAVAAMRAGFHVIKLAGEQEGSITRTETVADHVAYGIDWHPNGHALASCSFYNNQGQFF